jgi:hypothetical protein
VRERKRDKNKGKEINDRKQNEFGVNLVKKKRRNEEMIEREAEERQVQGN